GGPVAGRSGSVDTTASAAGASSSIRCALVPLMPNDDTAHRRGTAPAGHSTASVSGATVLALQSTCVDGWFRCSVAGSVPCRIAITIFNTLATPAADWLWPMLDLTEP